MYEQRFGLKRRPFPSTPDGSTYYPATAHEHALTALDRGIRAGDGFFLLTGAPGTGKTLIATTLLDRLPEGTVTALVTNSHLPDRASLLQAILYDLGLPYDGAEQVLRLRLTDFVLEQRREGRQILLILDEAQNLSADLLEELRLLANLESGAGKALQVLLVGQPAILDTLRRPELAALRQRLGPRCELTPLATDEAFDYLLHHLRLAGANAERIIDESGLDVLARGTKGVPRLLNQAAHQALLLADAGELASIDAEAALEALAALGLADDAEEADGEATLRVVGERRQSA